MPDSDDFVGNLYTTDEYIIRNPSLHEEDSPWKVNKIIPLADRFARCIDKGQINLLDVGGGAGLILGAISSYIEKKHNISVNKYALDLSPGALEIQKQRNPDLKKALNEDICMTSLGDKEIDLTLLIDLLEHVTNPVKALEEVRRISNYAIFKVPLDGFLIGRIWNFIKRGEPRRQAIQSVGHINIYTYGSLRNRIQNHTGQILDCYFTNVYEYYLNSQYYKGRQSRKDKLLALGGALTFRLCPRLAAFIFNDSAMFLVRCN
jgi:SAM-dependent methyltransferase